MASYEIYSVIGKLYSSTFGMLLNQRYEIKQVLAAGSGLVARSVNAISQSVGAGQLIGLKQQPFSTRFAIRAS